MSRLRSTSFLTYAAATAAVLGILMSAPDIGGSTGSSAVATPEQPKPQPTNPTFLADRDRWRNLLIEEAKEVYYHDKKISVVLKLATAVKTTARLVNFRKVSDLISETNANSGLNVELRNLLDAHAIAIEARRYKDEYPRTFSDSKAQPSAASDFFAAIGEAITEGKRQHDADMDKARELVNLI